MIHRICVLSSAIVVPLLAVAPALAEASKAALEGAERSVGPATPEPAAVLLFAAGAGFVAWTVRRRSRR